MKSISFITLFSLLSLYTAGQSNVKFSKEVILEDLKVLRESLQDAHYNLFAYTTETTFEAIYKQIKSSINKDSFNLLETTNLFQRLISSVNNGHTEIGFPGQSYRAYAFAGGTIFPLEIAFEADKPLIRKNWSDEDNIQIGSELLSINGIPIEKIIAKISPQISAERLYFKQAKIELYSFPRLYWQVFGQQEEFIVEVASGEENKTYSIKAVDLIEGFEVKRNEVLNAKMELKFLANIAYLNPGNFGGDEQKYQQFIDSSFLEINKQKPKNLIIDLRNNSGGDDSFSDYLVSYLADKPFKWNSSFTLKTSKFLKEHVRENYDTTNVYWKKALTHKNGEIYNYVFDEYQPQAKAKRYHGKVYVLINRQSYSQAAVTAAQIQDYKFGTLVGEETGDYPSLYASQFQYVLPNTAIQVKVSKGYIVRVSGNTEEKGVIPDLFIKDYFIG